MPQFLVAVVTRELTNYVVDARDAAEAEEIIHARWREDIVAGEDSMIMQIDLSNEWAEIERIDVHSRMPTPNPEIER
jgi:hypothetical protein